MKTFLHRILRALRTIALIVVCALALFINSLAHAILDAQNNGMSDLWEKKYNNGDLFPASFLPTADPDQDGWDNITEAVAGTDPFLATGEQGKLTLHITGTTAIGFYQLQHAAVLGKNYQIQGSYDCMSWSDILEPTLAQESQITSISGVSTSTGAVAQRYFWRVLVTDADSDGDGLSNTEELALETNPYHNDTDNDGIHDKNELLRNLDPLNYDTDGDRLPDGQEDAIFTLASNPDTDGDGISDGQEVATGTNPLLADTDGDGLTDLQEQTYGTNPLALDSDGDGLHDGVEIANGSAPLSPDTDLDGILDGADVTLLTNDAIADPDGANLPAALNDYSVTGRLLARYDFESIVVTSNGNGFPSSIPGQAQAKATFIDGDDSLNPSGLPSFTSVWAENPTANPYLSLPYQIANNQDNQTWSYWLKLPAETFISQTAIYTLLSIGIDATAQSTNTSSPLPALHWYCDPATGKILLETYQSAGNIGSATQIGQGWDIPPTWNDGKWHHITLSKNNNQYEFYYDGQSKGSFTAQNISTPLTANSYIYIGLRDPSAATQAEYHFCSEARLDRLRVYKTLTAAEIDNLYKQNIDHDDMADFIETASGYWHDHNANAICDSTETYFARDPFRWESPTNDADNDDLTDSEEMIHGTNPFNPDTDGDRMPDGWEDQHELDPLDPSDAEADIDSDGLSNLDEFRHGTHPYDADSDSDGTSDGGEVNGSDGDPVTDDGSNPNDPADDGARLPSDQLISLRLGVGDRSGSHSEDYQLHVFQIQPDGSEKLYYTLHSDGFGGYKEAIKSFPKTHTYTFQIDWQATNNRQHASGQDPDDPLHITTTQGYTSSVVRGQADFDYHLVIEPQSGHENHTLIDAYDPRNKTVDTSHPLLDTQDENPADDDDDNVTDFLRSHEPRRVLLLRAAILVDANRDGQFSKEDERKITEEKPWRIWVNDDDDTGETGGTDISNTATDEKDYANNYIDQERDLVDFFPATLKIQEALRLLPSAKHDYTLKMTGGPIYSPLAVAWIEETALQENYGNCSAYQKEIPTARVVSKKKTHAIMRSGMNLPTSMTDQLHNGNGMMILEGRIATTDASLTLAIKSKATGNAVAEIKLPVSISKVEDMYRYKFVMPNADNLTNADIPSDPPNWPDKDRNNKHLVFAHGYNVNPAQSKAWASELFKRMYQSGSNAKLSAFAWYGYESQIGTVSPNYQINLKNAFDTAKSFKQFLDLLEGTKTVAAHSMGNVLVGFAMQDWDARPSNYIMLNSAAAKECYDANEAEDPQQEELMVLANWKPYRKELRASEWNALPSWPENDYRKKLTWKNRLSKVIDNGGLTVVYNFHSAGEEVLNNPKATEPNPFSEDITINGDIPWLKANKTWAIQEKRKGLGLTGVVHSSNYGGWKANIDVAFDPLIHQYTDASQYKKIMKPASSFPLPPTALNNELLVNLTHNPFFDETKHKPLFDVATGDGSIGSDYAKQYHSILIAEMIPCTTLATGRNALLSLGNSYDHPIDPGRNIDMHNSFMTNSNEWPYRAGKHDPDENLPRAWCHSDIREVAFVHTWKAYKKIMEIGNLNNN